LIVAIGVVKTAASAKSLTTATTVTLAPSKSVVGQLAMSTSALNAPLGGAGVTSTAGGVQFIPEVVLRNVNVVG
jgi:hypothetical protein